MPIPSVNYARLAGASTFSTSSIPENLQLGKFKERERDKCLVVDTCKVRFIYCIVSNFTASGILSYILCDGLSETPKIEVLYSYFISALWPFSTLGWPDLCAKDFKRFYPTTMLEIGFRNSWPVGRETYDFFWVDFADWNTLLIVPSSSSTTHFLVLHVERSCYSTGQLAKTKEVTPRKHEDIELAFCNVSKVQMSPAFVFQEIIHATWNALTYKEMLCQ
ncbi:hypothetical protein JHK82_012226 [Glycine max]|nr:hypothetical protein JHK82_012226 [Glycine max]